MTPYAKRLLLAAAIIASVLFVIVFEVGKSKQIDKEESDDWVWRDGYCIWLCEPIGGVPLDHVLWKLEDRWLCACSDGRGYIIP